MIDTKDFETPRDFRDVLLTVIAAVVISSGAFQIATYRELGILQFEVSEMQEGAKGFLTRAEADQRGHVRDFEMSDIQNRLHVLEARVLK